MTSFPSGQLVLREFHTVTEAHLCASQMAASAVELSFAESEFRLIEVSPTAGGAWVCAWLASENPKNHTLANKCNSELVDVDSHVLNAMLSLGPKPASDTTFVGLLESSSIVEVLKAAHAYSQAGQRLLEVRIKRSGPAPGAYAFFALRDSHVAVLDGILPMVTLPMLGDYRRFF